MQGLTAGSMNFGSNPVVLQDSPRSGTGKAQVDGVLGLQILFRHKAMINCRTRLVFFKVDQARQINLGSVAASEKFTRVPIQREETGALTVPCSIRGQTTRLLVDTGAFVTILHEGFVKSLGLAAESTRDHRTVRPRSIQTDQRGKNRRPQHWRLQSAAQKIWRRSAASVRIATRQQQDRGHPRHGRALYLPCHHRS